MARLISAQPRESRFSKATPRSASSWWSVWRHWPCCCCCSCFTSRTWLQEYPLTAKTVTAGLRPCSIARSYRTRDVSKIHVLSRSVYSHPNLPKLLIISSSIQNDAGFARPYPLLEISFLNSNAEVVALRFSPRRNTWARKKPMP
ncbi:MAG: DUF3426 domain-containing protein [Thiolinea sp.]